jgi:hypothetical protein
VTEPAKSDRVTGTSEGNEKIGTVPTSTVTDDHDFMLLFPVLGEEV